jgi:VanZ family protein
MDQMITLLARAGAWLYTGALVCLTLGPPSARPETPIPHDLEHLGAFGLSGLLISIGYRSRYVLIPLAGVGLSAVLEALQMWVPGRHPRWIDFAMDASGFCIGVGVGLAMCRLCEQLRARRTRPVRSNRPIAPQ